MKRRILAVLLAMALVVELGAVPTQAETPETVEEIAMVSGESEISEELNVDETDESETGSWINPIYAGSPKTLPAIDETKTGVSSTGASTYRSIAAAAKYLKGRMVARTQSVSFNYTGTQSSFETLLQKIFDKAWTVTSNPQEGDYLRYHVYGYRYEYKKSTSGGTTSYSVQLTFVYQSTAAQEAWMTTGIASAVSSLALTNCSQLQKIKRIHDYICEHVSYDYSYSAHSAYDAMYYGSAVCQGYANLFYAMCVRAGIEVRSVTGDSDYNGTSDHIWNIVKLGSSWYNVDATWDSQPYGVEYNYFLKSNSDFAGHVRDAEYQTASFNAAYPMSTISYTGTVGTTTVTSFVAEGTTSLVVRWSKVSTASGYYVYYTSNKNGKWYSRQVQGGGITALRLSGCKAGTTYYVKVQPYTDYTGSVVQGKATAIASTTAVPAKAAISSLATGSRKLIIKWGKVTGANGYQVYYSYRYKGKSVKRKALIGSGSTVKKTIRSIPKGVKVSVKVRAYCTVNGKKIYGNYSAVKKKTIK